jgi:hypothetical protein
MCILQEQTGGNLSYLDIEDFVHSYECAEDEPETIDVSILKPFMEEVENDE